MSNSKIKICGIRNIDTLKCCIENNIDFYGLIFYEKSPRNISHNQALKLIEYGKNKNISSVGVFVDKKIEELIDLLKYLNFDYIQLHGKENDEYIKNIKKFNKLKIIKVISVRTIEDVNKINEYPNSDFFLFDYKANKNELPGGNAKTFNWNLLRNMEVEKPWFLSGGINISNINNIKNHVIPYGIDISSGVEDNPGIKNNEKIVSLSKFYDSK